MSADQELVNFLLSQGHTPERAEQIAGNHPDEVRSMMGEKKPEPPAEQSTKVENKQEEPEIPAPQKKRR